MIAFDDLPPAAQPAFALFRHLLGCHRRHCAGRPRASADLLHLREIAARLDALAVRLADVAALGDDIAARAAVLRVEIEVCAAARYGPLSDVERAASLAALASQQFALYRRLFAGRARLTRRTELVQRLYFNLHAILHEMTHVDGAALPSAADHATNTALITEVLGRLEDEDNRIYAARQAASRDELIRQLGADASAEIVAYRRTIEPGARSPASLDALGGICDRLGELAHQMHVLGERCDDTIHLANLRLASRQLARCEQRHAELAGEIAAGAGIERATGAA